MAAIAKINSLEKASQLNAETSKLGGTGASNLITTCSQKLRKFVDVESLTKSMGK